jgi:hypothetical protein
MRVGEDFHFGGELRARCSATDPADRLAGDAGARAQLALQLEITTGFERASLGNWPSSVETRGHGRKADPPKRTTPVAHRGNGMMRYDGE